MLGFAAATAACAISGFAGVYFEKILKDAPTISLWVRNIQLSLFGLPASFLGVVIQDGCRVIDRGFFYGFDALVWFAVVWYAIGGFSAALCIKYADNIAKNFATSVAIILATIGSVLLFDFKPTLLFLTGVSLVIVSIFLYSPDCILQLPWFKKSSLKKHCMNTVRV